MERKTSREVKKIVKDIYGEDMILMSMSETRPTDSEELLWDSLVFKNHKTKEEIDISFIEFEDIGYVTEEYNEHGDTPSNCERWNELDKRLGVEEL